MSYKQKNTIVSLVTFTLIILFYCIRVFQLLQNDNFESDTVFRLWGIVIFFAVIATIVVIILTDVMRLIIEAKGGDQNPEVDTFEDERDKLIDLRGTRITYTISSLGSFLAMLTFVLGQPPLVMFTALIFFGLCAQIVGDITRLALYRDGV